MTQEVTKDTFEQVVLKSDKPVMVDFWAPWCAPCKALAPAYEDLATSYQDRAELVKVNVDDEPELGQQYGVRGIPTVIMFKDGVAVQTVVGGVTKGKLQSVLDAHTTA